MCDFWGEAPKVRGGGPPGRDPIVWFPNNVACNFPVNLSHIEIGSLQFQRLWTPLKIRATELHATCVGGPLTYMLAVRTPASCDAPAQAEKL